MRLTRQTANAAQNEHLMHEVLCWDAGLYGIDHYCCHTLQHRHVAGTLCCRGNEHKKAGWITLRPGTPEHRSVGTVLGW